MIGTNRDLREVGRMLDLEINRLQRLATGASAGSRIDRRLSLMYRQRISISAALANRHIEASNKVVIFSRWFSGAGALGACVPDANHVDDGIEMAR